MLDQREALVGIIAVGKNGDELISAEAREGVFFAHHGFHAMGNGGVRSWSPTT